MNARVLIAAVAALSFAATGAADAKNRHKRYRAYYGVYVHVSPYAARTPGPPWAAPWECYTDEGYGRYRPCNAGRGGR
ncbi:MAG: hypothetical protein E6G97_11200 [Alphaproteobacteria bacterium]|nr:MAG: hypothetical protein E6G97_11200 [Alphaproteobacteria bacterium]